MPDEIVVETPVATPAAEPAKTEPAKVEPADRREVIRSEVEKTAGGKTDPVIKTDAVVKDGRNDKGQFAPKADAPQITNVKKERKYPSSWKKDYEPLYKELEANEKYHPILDEAERREQDYLKGIEPYKESSTFAQTIRKVLQPYEARIRALNMPPEQAIQALLNADHILTNAAPRQKAAYLKQLARSYGVQLEAGGEELQQPQIDPFIMGVAQRQHALEQRIEQQDLERAGSQAESFGKDKPYFNDVRNGMGDALEFYSSKGVAKSLDELYDSAIWSNPDIRAKVLAKQQADTEAKRQEEAKKSVASAKSANVQVRGAPSSGASVIRPVTGKSRREVIVNAMNRT